MDSRRQFLMKAPAGALGSGMAVMAAQSALAAQTPAATPAAPAPTADDRLAIADLITGWIYRDRGDWDQLLKLFHDDGRIEVTWFEGSFADFVAASRRMGASNLKTKHLIGMPLIEFNGDRAVVETNAMIACYNKVAGMGCDAHSRVLDWIERRHGEWKVLRRWVVYDMGSLNLDPGTAPVDPAVWNRFPFEYAALGSLLHASGYEIKKPMPTRGSDAERKLRADAQAWLHGTPAHA